MVFLSSQTTRSAGQANTSTNNPPSVPRPRALRRLSITRINASNQVTNPMPEQGAYLLVKESLKTVKPQVNVVAKLLPGYVKKKKGRAVPFGAGEGRETILNFYAEDSEDSEDSYDSEADSPIAEQFESLEEERGPYFAQRNYDWKKCLRPLLPTFS